MNPRKEDGVDHINVYSRGRTKLGRLLSNFAHTPFMFQGGRFESVEAWWYWHQLKDRPGVKEQQLKHLMSLFGFAAKSKGSEMRRELGAGPKPTPRELKYIYERKLAGNPHLTAEFSANTLPFDHYYVYGNKIVETEYRWTGQLWNEVKP